jgi:hypothetical protein
MASGVAVVKTSTDLHPLCYEHHVEMSLVQILLRLLKGDAYPAQTLAYACPEPDCLIHYNSPVGYFTTQDGTQLERESAPRVACPHHGLPMYLGEVKPERSFRLWRCPQLGCHASRTNEDLLVAGAAPLGRV